MSSSGATSHYQFAVKPRALWHSGINPRSRFRSVPWDSQTCFYCIVNCHMPVVKVSHLLTIRLCPASVSFLKLVATRWILCMKPWGSGHRWHKRLKGPVAPSPQTETRWENRHVCVWCCLFPCIYVCAIVPLLGSLHFSNDFLRQHIHGEERGPSRTYFSCSTLQKVLICQVGVCRSFIVLRPNMWKAQQNMLDQNLEIRL